MSLTRFPSTIALAIVGLVLAAAVTYLASTLVSQPIGLSSEPATLGGSLAPPRSAPRSLPALHHQRPQAKTATVTVTSAAPSAPAAPPTTATARLLGDDQGGRRDGDD
ncbi:MAG: hypothetical protein U0842_28525 [Candidatus Binatia bacterium]